MSLAAERLRGIRAQPPRLVLAGVGRARLRAQWRELFKTFDAVICPVMPTPAYPHDHSADQETRRIDIDGKDYIYPDQLRARHRHPARPAGDRHTDRPFAAGVAGRIQIVGPWLEDRTPLELAALIEREFGASLRRRCSMTKYLPTAGERKTGNAANTPSLRAKRSNPASKERMDCFVASRLRLVSSARSFLMCFSRISSVIARSEATKQSILSFEAGLLRFARNDGVLDAFRFSLSGCWQVFSHRTSAAATKHRIRARSVPRVRAASDLPARGRRSVCRPATPAAKGRSVWRSRQAGQGGDAGHAN